MDRDSLLAAYEQYMPAVYARCRRILRERSAALDATQEVFVRAVRHQAELRPGTELLHWFYRVATNVCLNTIRAQRQDSDASAKSFAAAEGKWDPTSRWEVLELLRGLDERTQAVAICVHVDGMTHREAASVLQITDRTVRNCLARFVSHCRNDLDGQPHGTNTKVRS